MKKIFLLLVLMALCLSDLFVLNAANKQSKVLLIPLDSRPPCLQFVQKIGQIGQAQVVAPPDDLLGKFTIPGQCYKIIEWINSLNLKEYDAMIVSMDMITYGSLVESRVLHVGAEKALQRLEVLRYIKKKAPNLPIYVESIVMRLAPTADGKNESYRVQLAEWAEISAETDDSSKARTAELEKMIPANVLADYKMTRERDLLINLKSIDLVQEGVIDYLILGQDDSAPRGVHLADRTKLHDKVSQLNLSSRVSIQSGTDDVSMLLLAKAITDHHQYVPGIKVVYDSESIIQRVMPFEDEPLCKIVSDDIKSSGAKEVSEESDADLILYVFASRHEKGAADAFATRIAKAVDKGLPVLVADIDPKGDVQGSDSAFSEALMDHQVFPRLYGYASWNTASNTLGTVIPQGTVYAVAKKSLSNKDKQAEKRIEIANHWFKIHRVLDDFYFHNLVRAQVNQKYCKSGLSSIILSDEDRAKAESFALQLMQSHLDVFSSNYFNGEFGKSFNLRPNNLMITLPWNRTFEAFVDFQLK
nr:DUF4127 family protein [uncultured Macellibacteroides sp.]